MGLRLLFLLWVCCCCGSSVGLINFNIISPDTVQSATKDVLNIQHLFKTIQDSDEPSMECGISDVWNIKTICDQVQLCGNGLCQCCIDYRNRSVADCSGLIFNRQAQLSSIPPLPVGVQVLKFSSNGLQSNEISLDFFDNVRDLTHLYLSNNGLTYVLDGMFRKLTKLKCLNLNGNFLLQEQPETLPTLLAIPGLQELSVSMCLFPIDGVQFPENSSVESLYMAGNPSSNHFIYDMAELSKLHKLKMVVFDANDFKLIYNPLPVQAEILAIGFSDLVAFPTTCSQNGRSLFPKLKTLSLEFNAITNLNPFVEDFCLPKLNYLELNFNLISTLHFSIFSSEHFPKLRYLSAKKQNNALYKPFSIEAKAFSNPSLEKLCLEHNDIWFGRRDLVAADAFDNCTNLEVLYLDGNSLRDVDDDRFLELFGGLHSLQNLSLSVCQLETISTRTFQTLTNLTHLYLDGNLISYIPHQTFEPLQYLELLDLSNNKLTFLSDQAFRQGFQYTLHLSLGRNPFICSCELIWLRECETDAGPFVVYLPTHDYFGKTYVNDTAANYKCHNLQGFSVSNFSLARQACLLSEQTSVLITYTCSLLVVALTAFLLLFAYRWHFRLLLFEAFRGNGQARRLRLQQNNFKYDVFVSYTSDDMPWVRRHLMPQLEDRLGLRLCIHERDFILGHNIVDNVAECVESSKKILMVFSKSFVLSQWCQFELTYCLSHVLEYDDSLIIVCVDDVVSHEMTSAMMAVLKTTTYIQWMEEENATESFWGRIKIALQEILNIGEHVV